MSLSSSSIASETSGTSGASNAQPGAPTGSVGSLSDTAPRIGFWVATALVVGNVIGAGIFLLPATLAPFGWSGVIGWFVTLAGALCLAWVFAQLSRHLPDAGGAFGFMRLALGDVPAFIGAWGYWVSVWVANAAIATGATAGGSAVGSASEGSVSSFIGLSDFGALPAGSKMTGKESLAPLAAYQAWNPSRPS